jgi:hypothetical protein
MKWTPSQRREATQIPGERQSYQDEDKHKGLRQEPGMLKNSEAQQEWSPRGEKGRG